MVIRSIVGICASIALVSCRQIEADGSICGRLEKQNVAIAANWAEQRQILVSCVDNWAARMSRSSEPAPVVASATLVACSGAIEREQQLAAKEKNWNVDMSAARQYWHEQALFRAVQWRAGRCNI